MASASPAFDPRTDILPQPQRALRDEPATIADLWVLRRDVFEDGFGEASEKVPPGIVDPRSWAYLDNVAGRFRPPPMPARRL